MANRESKIQKKILTAYEVRGFWVVKIVRCNKAGVLDIIACSPKGRFYATEVKDTGKLNEATPLQRRTVLEILSRGGRAAIFDNVAALELWLDSMLALENSDGR